MRIFVLVMSAFCVAAISFAGSAATPPIEISNAWARATAPSASNGAAYLTIANHGPEDDRLTGASSPVAAKVEIHITADQNGVTTMRPLADLPVKAGETVEFQPRHLHIMLFGLTAPLQPGMSFPLTLDFAKAGTVTTKVTVATAAPPAGGSMPGMKMGH